MAALDDVTRQCIAGEGLTVPPAWKLYLLRFAGKPWVNQELPELDEVLRDCGLNPDIVYNRDAAQRTTTRFPFIVAAFPSDELALSVARRCFGVATVSELWAQGKQYSHLLASLEAFPENRSALYVKGAQSWSCDVTSFGISIKAPAKERVRARVSHAFLPTGPINLRNPDNLFVTLEVHTRVKAEVKAWRRPALPFSGGGTLLDRLWEKKHATTPDCAPEDGASTRADCGGGSGIDDSVVESGLRTGAGAGAGGAGAGAGAGAGVGEQASTGPLSHAGGGAVCVTPNAEAVEKWSHLDNAEGKEVKRFSTLVWVYFLRQIGTGARSMLTKYTLKKRPYLGPTSMDAELSFVMANMAHVKPGHLVFDPFCGTASLLVSAAALGARTMGSDIDMLVLKGMLRGNRKKDGNVFTNFAHYGLQPPEIIRFDSSVSIITDPPYGMRAGAKRTGRADGQQSVISAAQREAHIAMTMPYQPEDLLRDLLDLAARTIIVGGHLVYVLPIGSAFSLQDMPQHPCFRVRGVVEEVLVHAQRRLLVCMEKVNPFDESLKNEYNVVVGGSIGHASEDVAAWQVTRQHEGSTGGAESGSAAIPTDRPMSKAERKRMRKKAWKLANPMSRKQRRRQKEAREKKFQEERCAREAQAGVASRGTGSVGESGGAATAQTAPKGEADV